MSEKKKRTPAAGTNTGADAGSDEPSGRSTRRGATTPSISAGPMDVALLAELVKLMAANDLNTVEVRDGDKRVVLKRGAPAPTITYGAPMPTAAMAPAQPSQPQAGASAGAGPGTAPAPDEGLVAIKAEMVGTFYSSPKPGEPAFVNPGSTVDDETTVCVIEAMKNFFPVKAGVRGSIAKVLVQNGQTVQFDQALFLVKPA